MQSDLRVVRAAGRSVQHDLDVAEATNANLTRERDRLASFDSELSAIESALDDCAPRAADGRTLSPLDDKGREAAIDRDRLAAEAEQLTAAVNAAASDHAAVEAERERLAREVDGLRCERDCVLDTLKATEGETVVEAAERVVSDRSYSRRTTDAAVAECDRMRAQLTTAESDRTRLYQCASEQGEADAGNGLVLVRKTDLLALRSRQTGADAATVRLLHDLLDRLIVVDGRGGVA